MDCNECKLKMVSLLDKTIDRETLYPIIEHLLQCPDCAEEYRQSEKMMSELKPGVLPEAPSLLKQNIINQLIKDEAEMKNETTKVRWLSPKAKKILSIAAVLILAMLIVPFTLKNDVFMSSTSKAANKLLAASIEASQAIKSMVIHLKVRTLPGDNFELVGTDFEMVDHTITKSFENPVEWRIDKGGRVVVCNGKNQYLWVPDLKYGLKAGAKAGFVEWFKMLLDPQSILAKEQKTAQERSSKITMNEKGNEILMTITSNARGNFINDYSRNKSIEESDNRREYVFEKSTKLLKGLKIYIIQGKKETLILETEKIDYDAPVDASLFAINLPEGVEWSSVNTNITSDTFSNITSKQAAELIFNGMAKSDWESVKDAFSQYNEALMLILKKNYDGITVIKVGESFKSGTYKGEFVPYEIKFKSGKTKKWNLALRNDNKNKVWIVDGGI